MRLIGAVAGLCVAATVVAGCGGSSGGGSATGGKVVNGATFTMALNSDPGNLDPQASAGGNLSQISEFAYDRLLSETATGKIVSGLASSWQVKGNQVVMTLHKHITCSDGSEFTAADAAANLNYVADPKNKSPFLGVYVPVGSHATSDASAGTVTLTTASTAPFVLDGLASVSMVCAKGMQNRKTLATGSDGTGPYRLTQAVSGDQYTYVKRSGYTWGPNGVGTDTKGLPDKVVVKIITNATTAANLLLSGGLNAANVLGPDIQRLDAAHLFSGSATELTGEMWFNQATGRPTADPAVRQALTKALDLAQLQKVLTSGRGAAATQLAVLSPAACTGNSVSSALPSHDLNAAKQLLDTDGWKMGSGGVRTKNGKQLALNLVYLTELGAGASAAVELATQVWKQLGVKITSKAQDETAIQQTVFSTGNWDITWLSLNVSSPDQLVPFMSGAAPPQGTNFAHINNAKYDAEMAKASKIVGTKGCPDWLAGESDLIKDADVIPFANEVLKFFGNKTRFTIAGELVPTSIRMLAG